MNLHVFKLVSTWIVFFIAGLRVKPQQNLVRSFTYITTQGAALFSKINLLHNRREAWEVVRIEGSDVVGPRYSSRRTPCSSACSLLSDRSVF